MERTFTRFYVELSSFKPFCSIHGSIFYPIIHGPIKGLTFAIERPRTKLGQKFFRYLGPKLGLVS